MKVFTINAKQNAVTVQLNKAEIAALRAVNTTAGDTIILANGCVMDQLPNRWFRMTHDQESVQIGVDYLQGFDFENPRDSLAAEQGAQAAQIAIVAPVVAGLGDIEPATLETVSRAPKRNASRLVMGLFARAGI